MERRLSAILAADVVGYSRLMGEEEVGTLERLKTCRGEVIDPAIAEFHGRIVKLMGDGALVEFASVVDAVHCAAEIQRRMPSHDQGAAEARRIRFRIGVNLGDVIVDGSDIYGDGVNVAARLEGLAEPGGICISGTAFDHVVNKANVGFASLGEKRLKNIADPVRVYRVLLDPAKAGKRAAASFRPGARTLFLVGIAALLAVSLVFVFEWQKRIIPTRPSVAVLPFANLSGDPSQDYFADGVTEAVITDLAKLSELDVIARNSVSAYKGRAVDPAEVAGKLGVRYVVEGSVQRAGEQIRIDARLIDATTGEHLWANRFERAAAEVFAVQDEMSRDIVDSLGMKTTASEKERLARPPTANLEAYDDYLRGEQAARTGRPAAMREALDSYAKAVALDPSFAEAYAADARAAVYIWRNSYDDVLQAAPARKLAYESAGKALQLNPDLSLPYAMLSVLQVVDWRYDEAIESARRAVALGPGDVEAQVALSYVYLFAGKFPEAAAAIDNALKLDPNLPPIDRQVAGLVAFFRGDDRRAIAEMERARDDAPGVGNILIGLGAAYARAGRIADARAAVARGIRFPPNYGSIAAIKIAWLHFRDTKDLALLIEALRRAGLPEWPFAFSADERDRLKGDEVGRLVLGHTLRGRIEPGLPAIMQIDLDGKTAFRSTRQFITETVFVDDDNLCEKSESVFGRPDCGPVYKRDGAAGEPSYAYVNSSKVLYFSPVK
jgi:TolB-like protein/class 3 adenylate cyclase/cytochrome c-type biogenesis protein CcmH/NrfG